MRGFTRVYTGFVGVGPWDFEDLKGAGIRNYGHGHL